MGLVAHLDTSPDAPGHGVEPLVHRSYDGGVLTLPRSGTRLDPAQMPELARKVGHDIVTGSGDTLLGADDKAGVAAIVAAVAHLAAHPELPRPTLRIAFTPDEEIGEGATLFDIERFGALCAYTIDGSEIGELQDETFSALEAIVSVEGVDVHPGFATGKLVNALRLAAQIVAALPSDTLTPETTSGREGFIHPYELTGTAARAQFRAILRDFDDDKLDGHLARLREVAETVVAAQPRARLSIDDRRQYRNMRRYLDGAPQVTAAAEAAIAAEGIEPIRTPIRGGTDGSRLSEMGLPTPNLFTGGHEYHSVREWASVHDMAAACATIVRLAEVWTRAEFRDQGRLTPRPHRRQNRSSRLAKVSGIVDGSLASVDGEIMLAAEATIPATDEGLIRGDGVFEVFRVYDGKAFAFEEHMARLERSAQNLRLALDVEAVRAEAHRLLAEAGAGPAHEQLRIVITRGGRRLIMTEPLHETPAQARLATVTYSPTRVLDGIKSLSYAANMLASRLARERGFDEALLVTPHGRVLEAPTSSFFWVQDGAVLTPPLDDHILASITRQIVIEVAGAQERPCTLDDLGTRRRGLPGLDRARGPADHRHRRAQVSGGGAGGHAPGDRGGRPHPSAPGARVKPAVV